MQGLGMHEPADIAHLAQVRAMIAEHGRDRTCELLGASKQGLIDITAEVLADETQRIGITYAGFCLTALPHKRLPDDRAWKKPGNAVTLLIEPGRQLVNDEEILHGVPYGAHARMILLYLQTQAMRTKSPRIELGRSMRNWMERMGISYGGNTVRALRDQAARLSSCSLKFFWANESARGFQRAAIIKRGLSFLIPQDSRQEVLWEDEVVLDPDFFQALQDHPVPLRDAAIRALKERSLSLDLYVWLAYRLHALREDTAVSWSALQMQFATPGQKPWHFRQGFMEAFTAALAAYPEARVSLHDNGVVLHPSRPPVAALIA
jgi:hypothetical protein